MAITKVHFFAAELCEPAQLSVAARMGGNRGRESLLRVLSAETPPRSPRGGVLLYALGIGNGSDFDLIHRRRLQRALGEAFALAFAGIWIGFNLAQFVEQSAISLVLHEQWLVDCRAVWIFA